MQAILILSVVVIAMLTQAFSQSVQRDKNIHRLVQMDLAHQIRNDLKTRLEIPLLCQDSFGGQSISKALTNQWQDITLFKTVNGKLENYIYKGAKIQGLEIASFQMKRATVVGTSGSTSLRSFSSITQKSTGSSSNGTTGSGSGDQFVYDFELHFGNPEHGAGFAPYIGKMSVEFDPGKDTVKSCNLGNLWIPLAQMGQCASGKVFAGFNKNGKPYCQAGTPGPRGSSGSSGSRGRTLRGCERSPNVSAVCIITADPLTGTTTGNWHNVTVTTTSGAVY